MLLSVSFWLFKLIFARFFFLILQKFYFCYSQLPFFCFLLSRWRWWYCWWWIIICCWSLYILYWQLRPSLPRWHFSLCPLDLITNQTKSMKCPSINCFVTYSSDTFLLCIFALLLPLLLLLLLLSCTLIPVLISYPSLIMLLFLSFSFSLCLHLYLSFKFSCFFFFTNGLHIGTSRSWFVLFFPFTDVLLQCDAHRLQLYDFLKTSIFCKNLDFWFFRSKFSFYVNKCVKILIFGF